MIADLVRLFCPWLAMPLEELPAGVPLAVAAGPGKVPEEWREAAPGAWIARPDAAGAEFAELMTAGQLRALLATRGDHL